MKFYCKENKTVYGLTIDCWDPDEGQWMSRSKGDPTPDALADVTSSLPHDRESDVYKIETKKEFDEIETYARAMCDEDNKANRALYGSNAPEWTCEVTSKMSLIKEEQ